MTKVYLAQIKCPNNHCIAAAGGLADSLENAQRIGEAVMGEFKELVGAGKLNYECGLCGSRSLRIDVAPTRFTTMEEARGPLFEMQMRQMTTAAMFHGSRN
jgi:hypothetical protein